MRRAALTLFAVAVLLPSVALARTQFFCAVDRLVRDSCCCPPKARTAPPAQPTLQRECCKLEKHAPVAAPIATAVDASDAPPPPAVAIEITPVLPPLRTVAVAITPRAQAPPVTSLLSQHAALLV